MGRWIGVMGLLWNILIQGRERIVERIVVNGNPGRNLVYIHCIHVHDRPELLCAKFEFSRSLG